MNQMDGWLSDAWQSVTGGAVSAWKYVEGAASGTYEYAMNKITEVSRQIEELLGLQSQVDKALAKMPEGADKARLMALRAESRGIFSQYIAPAWEKIKLALSSDEVQGNMSGLQISANGDFGTYTKNPGQYEKEFDHYYSENMGFIPLVAGGAVAAALVAALAVAGYVANAIITERQIMNDPALTTKEKAALVAGQSLAGSVSNIMGSLKWALIIAGLGFIGYKAMPYVMPKKSNPCGRRHKRSKGKRS